MPKDPHSVALGLKTKDVPKTLVDRIASLAKRYKDEYGLAPRDVILGPRDFETLYSVQGPADPTLPPFDVLLFRASQTYGVFWHNGMRLHLHSSDDILVGTLVRES